MKELIMNILVDELNYSEKAARITTQDLMSLDESLEQAFMLWVENRNESELKIDTFSTLMLMREKGLTYPAALIALDWLIKEPEIAKKELSKNFIR